MYYSGLGCQPPQHPTMMKGARDAVASPAHVVKDYIYKAKTDVFLTLSER